MPNMIFKNCIVIIIIALLFLCIIENVLANSIFGLSSVQDLVVCKLNCFFIFGFFFQVCFFPILCSFKSPTHPLPHNSSFVLAASRKKRHFYLGQGG